MSADKDRDALCLAEMQWWEVGEEDGGKVGCVLKATRAPLISGLGAPGALLELGLPVGATLLR